MCVCVCVCAQSVHVPSTQMPAATQCTQEQVPDPDPGHSSETEASDAADPAHGCCAAVEKWRLLADQIETVLRQHSYSEDDMLASMNRVEQRLDNIHTGAQLMSFFNSFGQSVPRRYHAGSMIRTQPTAAARRKLPGITRGAKRQASGRPAHGQTKSAKRPRHLGVNIDAGVAHAKSHGKGH